MPLNPAGIRLMIRLVKLMCAPVDVGAVTVPFHLKGPLELGRGSVPRLMRPLVRPHVTWLPPPLVRLPVIRREELPLWQVRPLRDPLLLLMLCQTPWVPLLRPRPRPLLLLIRLQRRVLLTPVLPLTPWLTVLRPPRGPLIRCVIPL